MDRLASGSLLIIGNGFDKNCGLKSSFSDFYSTVNKESNLWYMLFDFAFNNTWVFQAKSCIVNFINRSSILWMDIEDFIKRILFMHRDGEKKQNQLYRMFGCKTYLDVLKTAFRQRNNFDYLYSNRQFSFLKEFFRKNKCDKDFDINITEFLNDELKRFETDFKQYIEKETKNNEDYLNKTSKVIAELVGEEETNDILSFNYTTPDKGALGHFAYNNINNIHGSIESNIIIGYDSGDLIDGSIDGRLKMSKSWKKMFFPLSLSYLPSQKQITSIKIYGHSLGEQDYSYFYALFDHYDIYNSSVTLIFYYTPYGDTDMANQVITEKYISSVYKLLNSYVSKTSNAAKGNIVVNKLILENRIKILTIQKYS